MIIANGSTDVTTYFVLRDSTNHAPKTDVSITDIDVYYLEEGAAMAAKVDLTALAAADSAHADNKGYHCGQGLYRIDWPDAAFDGGIGKKVFLIVVCTGVDTTFLEVELSPPVNAVAISGDTTAADTLELFAEALDQATGQLDSGSLHDDTITAASINTGALTADAFAADAIAAATLATGAITSDAFAANAITNAAVADDVDVNVKTITAGAITAAAIADAAIDNATFAADVGSTAYATNIIALAAKKAIDEYDPPTKAEMDLRTLAAADYFDPAADVVAHVTLVDTTTTNTDMVSAAPSAATVADAVWDEALADHLGAGSTGNALNAAGSAGDPWATALPGAYGAGTAGKIIGDNINAAVSSRSSHSAADVKAAIEAAGSHLALILEDTAVIGAAGAGLTEAGGTGDHLTAVPWNAAWDAEVQSECADALNAYDPPTNAEMEARTLPAADYTVVADLGVVQTADHAAAIADLPTVAEFNARTLAAASYFDPAADTVAHVTLVDTVTTNSDMRGTDNAALAAVCTEARLSELDAATPGKAANQIDVIQTDTTTDIPALIDALPTAAEIKTEIEQAGSSLASILEDTAVIGAAGAGLTEAGGTGDHLTAVPWNAAWDAEVQSEVDDALGAAISEPANLSATKSVKSLLWWVFGRFYHKNTQTATEQKTYKADGVTANATRAVADDGTTQSLGAAS